MRSEIYAIVICTLVSMVNSKVMYEQCRRSGRIVVCRNIGWTDLPDKIYDYIEILQFFGANFGVMNESLMKSDRLLKLTLIDAGLKTLKGNQFAGLPNLRSLTMSENDIETLPENLFANNPYLSYVNLKKNKIKEIPENIFHPLTKLSTLIMSDNKISYLQNHLLTSCKILSQIDFSNNEIKSIGEHVFDRAAHIYRMRLNGNKIKELPKNIFTAMKRILLADFSDNKLQTIPWDNYMDTDVNRTWHVRFLYIKQNNISRIPEKFVNTIKMKYLDFGNNPLQCDCQLDWLRIKEIKDRKRPNHILPPYAVPKYHDSNITFKSRPDDKKHQICAGPPVYAGKAPWDFETLCEINECIMGIEGRPKPCGRNSICKNTIGSYECRCEDGFSSNDFSSNETDCRDINECDLGRHDCKKACFNTIGSYICDCKPGFTLRPDGECYDIDECTTKTHKCSVYATCSNNIASYVCECGIGFTGDGQNCEDIDECQTNTHLCPGIECVNTIGSYTCRCKNNQTGEVSTMAGPHIKTSDGTTDKKLTTKTSKELDKYNSHSTLTVVLLVMVAVLLTSRIVQFIWNCRGTIKSMKNQDCYYFNRQLDKGYRYQPLSQSVILKTTTQHLVHVTTQTPGFMSTTQTPGFMSTTQTQYNVQGSPVEKLYEEEYRSQFCTNFQFPETITKRGYRSIYGSLSCPNLRSCSYTSLTKLRRSQSCPCLKKYPILVRKYS